MVVVPLDDMELEFNGKTYGKVYSTTSHLGALSMAKSLRARGRLARAVKHGNWWEVYEHRR